MEAKAGRVDIESLLGTYAPSREPLVVTLPHGERLTFRAINSLSELDGFYAAAAQWYANLPDPGSDAAKIKKLDGILPGSAEEACTAFLISELSIEPKFTKTDAMRLMQAPWLAKHLADAISLHMKNIASLWENAVFQESKKNSGTTDGSGSNSPSARTSSTSTRTRSPRKRQGS